MLVSPLLTRCVSTIYFISQKRLRKDHQRIFGLSGKKKNLAIYLPITIVLYCIYRHSLLFFRKTKYSTSTTVNIYYPVLGNYSWGSSASSIAKIAPHKSVSLEPTDLRVRYLKRHPVRKGPLVHILVAKEKTSRGAINRINLMSNTEGVINPPSLKFAVSTKGAGY